MNLRLGGWATDQASYLSQSTIISMWLLESEPGVQLDVKHVGEGRTLGSDYRWSTNVDHRPPQLEAVVEGGR